MQTAKELKKKDANNELFDILKNGHWKECLISKHLI